MTAAEINGLEVILEYPCRRCLVYCRHRRRRHWTACRGARVRQLWPFPAVAGPRMLRVPDRSSRAFGRPTEPIRIFQQVYGGRVAHDRRHQTSAPESEDNNMDMRQFSGDTFIKLDDVCGNPLLKRLLRSKPGNSKSRTWRSNRARRSRSTRK